MLLLLLLPPPTLPVLLLLLVAAVAVVDAELLVLLDLGANDTLDALLLLVSCANVAMLMLLLARDTFDST